LETANFFGKNISKFITLVPDLSISDLSQDIFVAVQFVRQRSQVQRVDVGPLALQHGLVTLYQLLQKFKLVKRRKSGITVL
jgi:hypothetical protein